MQNLEISWKNVTEVKKCLTWRPKSLRQLCAMRWLLPLACVSWCDTACTVYADWLGCMWAIFAGRVPAVTVCVQRTLSHMQMREWYYTKGEFSKCHSARKLWEILCFERVLHSSPRPPRADWRDAIANPIKTHDSVFTTCRSFLASVGFNCFCRTFQLLITNPDFCWFSEPKSEIKAAVSLSDFGARQLINLFVFFFAAVH
jgi:hypothetical protein